MNGAGNTRWGPTIKVLTFYTDIFGFSSNDHAID